MNPSIRSAGLAALSKALGPTGMARFIQQYELGTGNYTLDSHRKEGRNALQPLLNTDYKTGKKPIDPENCNSCIMTAKHS